MSWKFRFLSATKGQNPRIEVYDDVGWWGVSLNQLSRDVRSLGDEAELDLHICSNGGDCWEGFGMIDFLRGIPQQVNTYVEGIAGSMASALAMVGQKRVIGENSFHFVHKPWNPSGGNATQMAKKIEVLDSIEKQITSIYTAVTGLTAEKVAEFLSGDTFLDSATSLELGFATHVGPAIEAKASIQPRDLVLDRIPEKARVFFGQAGTPEEPREAAQALEPGVVAQCSACGKTHAHKLKPFHGGDFASHWAACPEAESPALFVLAAAGEPPAAQAPVVPSGKEISAHEPAEPPTAAEVADGDSVAQTFADLVVAGALGALEEGLIERTGALPKGD